MDETDGSRLLLAGSDGIFGNDGGGGVANAQMIYIDVYPSQDNPDSQTLWLFGIRDLNGNIQPGTSSAFYGSSIRSSGGTNYHARDSWKMFLLPQEGLYIANKPTNEVFALSPLLSSTNTKDIASVTTRLAGSARVTSPFYSGLTFPSTATNSPTIRIGNTDKNIGWIFMNGDDEMGIRGTPPNNLVFTNGQTSRWIGSGILNKPIGDFYTATDGNIAEFPTRQGTPYFGRVTFGTHSRAIPEPSSFALAALFLAIFLVILKSAYEKRNGK